MGFLGSLSLNLRRRGHGPRRRATSPSFLVANHHGHARLLQRLGQLTRRPLIRDQHLHASQRTDAGESFDAPLRRVRQDHDPLGCRHHARSRLGFFKEAGAQAVRRANPADADDGAVDPEPQPGQRHGPERGLRLPLITSSQDVNLPGAGVGKRRRVDCVLPSGLSVCGPTMPTAGLWSR